MQDIHHGFRASDRTSDADALARFLDEVDALPTIDAYRREMIDRAGRAEGQRILDVGCGVGHAVLRLASVVGPTGFVAGVDKSDAFVAEARRRAEGTNAPVAFHVADARSLPFAERSFDVARTERVLMYQEDPASVLDAMVRVVRPRGTLVFFEFDYDCIVVDAAERELTRCLMRAVSDSVPSPWIGRQLPRLLRERGLRSIAIEPRMVVTPLAIFRRVVEGAIAPLVSRGDVDANKVERWWTDLERSDTAGDFFAGFSGFVVSGQAR